MSRDLQLQDWALSYSNLKVLISALEKFYTQHTHAELSLEQNIDALALLNEGRRAPLLKLIEVLMGAILEST